MFTGLIQALGKLQTLDNDRLQVTCLEPCDVIMTDIELGDSIAVDGVCLTVGTILPQGFIATASPETLVRSTLGKTPINRPVNLEASLRVGSKIGGHFVTGHVDGQGYLSDIVQTDSAWEISFTVPTGQASRYIVPKGSIGVNGISLTVAECSPSGDWFKVAVIPVTYDETNLQYLQPNDAVNLEGDILGKYVERFTQLGNGAVEPDISLDFLSAHGYG
ncbi:riboflavin synthase [Leptothoe spongobia]|uniref:Riboflavin synthase n=1 Tax=Leptothoe spongobia TAU-MAC 1115 TaxID=1967444 RepID=A0A947DCD9_9CYAN|nr:riboflavin synthase [Leptothoe spongobia]MBT9313874.1 riboflavin synthase [Leptothoe spongobia TAU-MAC 1115]